MIWHWPTLLFLIGFPCYWLELYFLGTSSGTTSFCATGLFILLCVLLFRKEMPRLGQYLEKLREAWHGLSGIDKCFIGLAALTALPTVLMAVLASFYPPHLTQEMDLLNYHYMVPRQHLIRHSFAHISWSVADLWLHPIQFAQAPFWFVSELPNKWPQLLITLGFWSISIRIASRFTAIPHRKILSGALVLAALLGSHGFGIQYGTGMMDIALCYLFLASIDSFLDNHLWLSALEMSFYVFGKSFLPIQTFLILGCLVVLAFIARRLKFSESLSFNTTVGFQSSRVAAWFGRFLLMSVLVGGPFVAKSLYYSGTPFYPVGTGIFSVATRAQERFPLLKQESDALWKGVVSNRSIPKFVAHFWTLAVPTKDVNNDFDYPMGLPYLLFLVPFLYLTTRSISKRQFPLLPILAIIFWAAWWASGAHQARFLYIPITLIFISVSVNAFAQESRGLKLALLLSLLLTSLSAVRSNRMDFGKGRFEVLRSEDKQLIELSKKWSDGRGEMLDVNILGAAYATVPVRVTRIETGFVMRDE